MNPARTWLPAAVRAHEARTLDTQRRVHDAWEALLDAAESEHRAGGRLDELSAAWAAERDMGRLAPALETLYRRFHTHLHEQADLAIRRRTACQDRWEAMKTELRRTHSTQRLLERFEQEIEAARRHELSSREAQSRVEAWLLGRLGQAAAEAGCVDAYGPTTHSTGGAGDPRAS